MNRRHPGVLLLAVLLSASAASSSPLMSRAQTVIDIPAPGQDVPLSSLAYKSKAFEAKLSTVRLEPKGDGQGDPYVATWTFLGSNNDGQMHKVEIWVRLMNDSGKQIGMFSQKCILPPGASDHPCVVEMSMKAETWKEVKSARIVADWHS